MLHKMGMHVPKEEMDNADGLKYVFHKLIEQVVNLCVMDSK